MKYTVDVLISLKKGILDAEGEATKKALRLLGYKNVESVSSIRVFRIELNAKSREDAEEMIREMCERMLANPVIQDYELRWAD